MSPSNSPFIVLEYQFDHEILRELLQSLTPMQATVVLQTRSGVISNKLSPEFDFWIGYTCEKFTVDPDLLQYCQPDFQVVYCLVLSESDHVMQNVLQEIQKDNFRDKVHPRMTGTTHTHLAPTSKFAPTIPSRLQTVTSWTLSNYCPSASAGTEKISWRLATGVMM